MAAVSLQLESVLLRVVNIPVFMRVFHISVLNLEIFNAIEICDRTKIDKLMHLSNKNRFSFELFMIRGGTLNLHNSCSKLSTPLGHFTRSY